MVESSPGVRRLVRVLVVDDSAYVRQTLRALLLSGGDIEVVGTAADGDEALRRVDELDPDVITLDLEMPRLDGFAFLRILMHRKPRAVIVVSSLSQRQNVLRALELGALDFVAKPDRGASVSLKQIRAELVAKVLAGAASQVEQLQRRTVVSREQSSGDLEVASESVPVERPSPPARGLVVVGTSTGGPSSLRTLLGGLPVDFPYGVVVAQHMPIRFTRAFAERLDRELALTVREAEAGQRVRCGHVYIAPGGAHTEVQRAGEGFELAIRPTVAEDRYTPSVDRLFSSAAESGGGRIVGLILTGMGSDGVLGVQYVRLHGGHVVAEDASTAVVFGMPRACIATGAVGDVLPLERIAGRLVELCGHREPGA
jgi:two-component system, chemotaxis family, protein-glutamate methylesterase/glutaminase